MPEGFIGDARPPLFIRKAVKWSPYWIGIAFMKYWQSDEVIAEVDKSQSTLLISGIIDTWLV